MANDAQAPAARRPALRKLRRWPMPNVVMEWPFPFITPGEVVALLIGGAVAAAFVIAWRWYGRD